jgi:uncharacterized protein YjeT (DUF2065 family)
VNFLSAWQDFLRALALALVLEGVVPFLWPGRARTMFAVLASAQEKVLRRMAFVGVLAGLIVLQLLHWLA